MSWELYWKSLRDPARRSCNTFLRSLKTLALSPNFRRHSIQFLLGFLYELFLRRNISYEDVFHGQRLSAESTLQTAVVESRLMCGLLCTFHPLCKTYNFCDPVGELILLDLHADASLQAMEFCVYVGMTASFAATCVEQELNVDIRNDLYKGNCDINNKRVDAIEGSEKVQVFEVDNWHSVKLVEQVECVPNASHGGLKCELDPEPLVWLHWVPNTTMTFEKAKRYCDTLGASVFADFDVFEANEEMFHTRMFEATIWVGLQKHGNCWRNQIPNIISTEIPWAAPVEPGNLGGNWVTASLEYQSID